MAKARSRVTMQDALGQIGKFPFCVYDCKIASLDRQLLTLPLSILFKKKKYINSTFESWLLKYRS